MSVKFCVEPGAADLAGYAARLAILIRYAKPEARGASASTYSRTKEVWGALDFLLNVSEKDWNEIIEIIPDRYMLPLYRRDLVECYKKLLKGLLLEYARIARTYNPRMKRELAKAVRDAVDKAVQYSLESLWNAFSREFSIRTA